MSETTPDYRKAVRYQYSKLDIGVLGILDELDQAEAQLAEAVKLLQCRRTYHAYAHGRAFSSCIEDGNAPRPGSSCDVCVFLAGGSP